MKNFFEVAVVGLLILIAIKVGIITIETDEESGNVQARVNWNS